VTLSQIPLVNVGFRVSVGSRFRCSENALGKGTKGQLVAPLTGKRLVELARGVSKFASESLALMIARSSLGNSSNKSIQTFDTWTF